MGDSSSHNGAFYILAILMQSTLTFHPHLSTVPCFKPSNGTSPPMENTFVDLLGISLPSRILESPPFGFLRRVKEVVPKTMVTESTVCKLIELRQPLDLWDLGEFDQKGTIRTKWGTFDDLKTLSKIAKFKDVDLYFDAVLNHKAAADRTEKCQAIRIDWNGPRHFVFDRVNIYRPY